jgi:hypothetical protein
MLRAELPVQRNRTFKAASAPPGSNAAGTVSLPDPESLQVEVRAAEVFDRHFLTAVIWHTHCPPPLSMATRRSPPQRDHGRPKNPNASYKRGT